MPLQSMNGNFWTNFYGKSRLFFSGVMLQYYKLNLIQIYNKSNYLTNVNKLIWGCQSHLLIMSYCQMHLIHFLFNSYVISA